jgi:two-component system CitB family sensor kinase
VPQEVTAVGRRWSLSGQLLALQLVIVGVVLVGVAAVSLAQTGASFRADAGRRATAAAETAAATVPLRSALEARAPAVDGSQGDGADDDLTLIRIVAESARNYSDATSVVVLDASGEVLASPEAAQLGRVLELPGDVLTAGRSWVGELEVDGRQLVLAQAPVMSDEPGSVGEVVGVVAVSRERPFLLEDLGAVAPNLLVYLGVASGLGVAGSLLVAQRVKRQTLGLEPLEITGLVEHRDATLHGIREGMVAVDLAGTVTLANDVARSLLHLPHDAVGRHVSALGVAPDLAALLAQEGTGTDVPVAVGDRVLVLNRMPIRSRDRLIGWVTTLCDRTKLLRLQRELDVVSDVTQTLRAQAHEFSNRLHTISGLIEIGEYDEVVGYVDRIGRRDAQLAQDVTSRIADPAVAGLLVAKTSLAVERGVTLRVSQDCALPVLEDELSNDVATVVGNLVDNAVDAVAGGHRDADGWVEVTVAAGPAEVVVTVIDSGPGIDAQVAGALFERGVSTKAPVPGGRGIGLSLVRLVCTRRGGSVEVRTDGPTVFVARLPVRVEVAAP